MLFSCGEVRAPQHSDTSVFLWQRQRIKVVGVEQKAGVYIHRFFAAIFAVHFKPWFCQHIADLIVHLIPLIVFAHLVNGA